MLVLALALWVSVGITAAQQEQHRLMDMSMDKEASPSSTMKPDERIALSLGAAAEGGLKLTMREHLEALQMIVAALGQEDFERAARVAQEELGFRKHHQAMQREAGATFPPKYHDLAMAHHQVAEDLAQAIPSRDMKKILPQLDRTMKACVACHQAYKL
jgi:hypothetical protein